MTKQMTLINECDVMKLVGGGDVIHEMVMGADMGR